MNEYYALYDIQDKCIGTYDRNQLRIFLNAKPNVFNCILSRLRGGKHKYIRVKGHYYRVYIYVEQK